MVRHALGEEDRAVLAAGASKVDAEGLELTLQVVLHRLIDQRKAQDPAWQPPALLRFVAWVFLDNPQAARWGRAAARLLGLARRPA